MRIHTIRLANLNALAGEWEIDLDHPAYADSIYALTGPTGAGKTTILDAISLALYGRTPRLERIGKAGNETMSRHSGHCHAEITFSTRAGRYRSHWSQHRARRKAGGELQNPKHELADATSGKILATGLKDTAAAIEKLTGMDYQRFTRAMLLAQGDFAAFLRAAPDERAPLLEQITGTEIYSRISIAVHERLRDALEQQRQLATETAGITPPDAATHTALPQATPALQQQPATLATRQQPPAPPPAPPPTTPPPPPPHPPSKSDKERLRVVYRDDPCVSLPLPTRTTKKPSPPTTNSSLPQHNFTAPLL